MVRQKNASMGWEPVIMGACYPVAIQGVRPNMLLDSCNGFTSHLEFCACFNGCIHSGEKESPSQPCTGWRLG
ncbi:hypothetical protein MTR_2g089005 [Medicago truncatula]|uniref:Uncharacterized protein n=1 Tax=Medicago truncatula TaxID=3880 RepID=A0A072VC57_MEDTR|nr:hypothetical protein MTR_2g089005 [Medicago truncatula]